MKQKLAKIFLWIGLVEIFVFKLIAEIFNISTFNTWYSMIALWIFDMLVTVAGILYCKEVDKRKNVRRYVISFFILFLNVALLGTTIKLITQGVLR